MNEQTIFEVRMQAAEMEREAARIRLDTAKREARAADRTLQMAEAVARSMMAREGIQA